MKRIKLLSIILLLIMNSCKTTEADRSFTIGKGGGFTGKYDVYLVKSNGDVFKVVKDQPTSELVIKIDKKQIAEIFKQFDQLNIKEAKFSHPGNINSFIRYQVDSKTYEIKWGSNNEVPPRIYIDFFDKVWNLIRIK